MTRAERRAAMPVSSAIWDDWLANEIQPATFKALENGHEINFKTGRAQGDTRARESAEKRS